MINDGLNRPQTKVVVFLLAQLICADFDEVNQFEGETHCVFEAERLKLGFGDLRVIRQNQGDGSEDVSYAFWNGLLAEILVGVESQEDVEAEVHEQINAIELNDFHI